MLLSINVNCVIRLYELHSFEGNVTFFLKLTSHIIYYINYATLAWTFKWPIENITFILFFGALHKHIVFVNVDVYSNSRILRRQNKNVIRGKLDISFLLYIICAESVGTMLSRKTTKIKRIKYNLHFVIVYAFIYCGRAKFPVAHKRRQRRRGRRWSV